MKNVETCYEETTKHMYIKRKQDEQSTYTTMVLISTLILTIFATGFNCYSLMTHYWEYVTWNSHEVKRIGLEQNMVMKSYENDPVTGVFVTTKINTTVGIFLVPMHGGIWTICISLNEKQGILLSEFNFPTKICVNYLTTKLFKEEPHHITDWNNRMQNVTISCALVSLIILGCAALTGAFGILKHQLSAILVTGVMYLLAGTFALFTIMIAHFKRIDCRRNHLKSNGIIINNRSIILDEGIIVDSIHNEMLPEFNYKFNKLYSARELNFGWSYDVGMIGVLLSITTSIMWIIMAKILRYTPITIQI